MLLGLLARRGQMEASGIITRRCTQGVTHDSLMSLLVMEISAALVTGMEKSARNASKSE